jgi:hypothetical protein
VAEVNSDKALQMSTSSPRKFKLVVRWMNDLRRNLDHLTQAVRRSLDQGAISENNVRMELLDVFEPLLGVMHDSVTYLQRHFNGGSFPAVKIHVNANTLFQRRSLFATGLDFKIRRFMSIKPRLETPLSIFVNCITIALPSSIPGL